MRERALLLCDAIEASRLIIDMLLIEDAPVFAV